MTYVPLCARRRSFAGALILLASGFVSAQVQPSRLPADRLDGPPLAEVLVLGSYHMGNPGRDIFNLKADDVLAPQRQAEIRELLDLLARFRPTKVAIEANPDSAKVKQYQDYLAGKYELGRDERDQVGFRLAKELNLPKVYGIDQQEDFPYYTVQDYAKARGREKELESLMAHFGKAVQESNDFLKSHTVLQTLLRLNSSEAVSRDLAAYALFAHFGEYGDYAGAGLLTDWYKRNIRIHTHLLNIIEPGDRVLIIYGSGHLRILRQNIEADPTLKLRTIEELTVKPAGGAVAGAGVAWKASALKAFPFEAAAKEPAFALIHATDLFRPHADPDDHFDLATVYSLAARGRIELLAVMVDHPPAGLEADPDALAVAQLNRLTGLAVPVLTGCSKRLSPDEASRPENRADIAGVMALLRLMRASVRPVLISVVGCCRDVAQAGRLEPKLFAAKCAGVYLNAGSGTRERAKAARLEYNVSLDPASYADIFELPCPVYWLPCFEVAPGEGEAMAAGEFGTYYRFLQKDVLDHLSPRLQNYFAFMFKQGASDREQQSEADALRPSWLRTLDGPRDEALLERQGSLFRNMWSTAGFFQMAGLSVTGSGALIERPAGAPDRPVYSFDPIRVRCSADGLTEWSPGPRSSDRHIFHIRDAERYPQAMTTALATLLSTLK